MARTKNFKEEVVLKKAMDLFWKQGFHATSMQQLVDTLGINRASMYDTFGSKEALFLKAFEEYRKSNKSAIKDFLYQYKNPKEGIQALFTVAIDQAVADAERKGCFVVNTTTEMLPGDVNLLPILKLNKKEFENIFYEYLTGGAANDFLTSGKDWKSISAFLYIYYNGLKVVSKVNPNKQELKSQLKAAMQVL